MKAVATAAAASVTATDATNVTTRPGRVQVSYDGGSM